MARYDFRLSEDEFWSITPRQFNALANRMLRTIGQEPEPTIEEDLKEKAEQGLLNMTARKKRR